MSQETITVPLADDNIVIRYSPYVFVNNGDKIMYIDPDIISKSKYCNKNSFVTKKEDIMNIQISKKTKRLQFIPDNVEVLIVMLENAKILKKCCSNVGDFYELLVYLDKFCFSADVLLESPVFMMWLNKIKTVSEAEWDNKDNADILQCTAEYRHEKHAFPTDVQVAAAPANAGYPGQVLVTPFIKPEKTCLPYNDCNDDETKYLEAIFTMLREREKYDVSCAKILNEIIWTYATSVRDCHMLLRSEKIMSIVKTRQNSDDIIHYMMKILYVDEINIKSNLREGHRIIIPSEISCHINTSIERTLESHPLTLMNGKCIKHRTGMTLPGLISGDRGIYGTVEITKRIDIYTCGYLRKFTWDKTALCGSCIPASSIINPLEKYCDTYDVYLQKYYPMILKTKDINISKKTYSFVTPKTVEQQEHPEIQQVSVSDIDIMIETTNDNEFDMICHKHFEEILQAIKEDRLQTIDNVTLEKKETENKYKYIVHGLCRPLEMFSVNNIPGVINKFHLSCVRAWFDGKTLMTLPSFIATANTGMNLDIRWVSCNKDIRATILKYFRKGFGIYLNKSDLTNIKAFITSHADEYRSLTFDVPDPRAWRRRYAATVWFSKNSSRIFDVSTKIKIDTDQLRQSYNRITSGSTVRNQCNWLIRGAHVTPKTSRMYQEVKNIIKLK